MYKDIDMSQLKSYNPKLHDLLYSEPERILDFKSSMVDHTPVYGGDAAADAIAEQAANKTPKTYTLPFFWGWLSPVFSLTASWIIAAQATT